MGIFVLCLLGLRVWVNDFGMIIFSSFLLERMLKEMRSSTAKINALVDEATKQS